MATLTTPRRLVFLSVLAVFIGLLGGLAAYVLYHLIALLTNLVLLHRWGWRRLPSFAHVRFGPSLVGEAAVGGVLVALLAKWSPIIKGHGIPEAMEAVLTRQSRISPRAALAKPLSAAIAIGTGGPFGAEGPIIVTGGSVGSLIGQIIRVSPSERKILLAAGAAAGMAATFGTPMAAVLLAFELLLFEFTTRAFIPLVIASTIAAGVHTHVFGPGPLFSVPGHDFAGLGKLPAFVVLGLVCGVVAVVVTKGLFVVEEGYRRLPISDFWHPVIGAVLFALVGLAVPRAMGVGYDAISDVLLGKLAVGAVAVLAVGKLVAWWFALASGTSGGTLAPLLLIGGSFGSLYGTLVTRMFPGLHLAATAFALVAMAAVFGASTGATFASIVFLFELTRDYQVILPLMLATVVADLIATRFLKQNIMTEKLHRRGLHVNADYEVDPLRTTAVSELMTAPVHAIPASASVQDARVEFGRTQHGAYPLVDEDGRVTGIISRSDLLLETMDATVPVADVASGDVVTVDPNDLAVDALELMLTEGLTHLPVVEDGRLVGMCTRADVLRARQRQLEHERIEPGWGLPLRWRRDARGLRRERPPAWVLPGDESPPVSEEGPRDRGRFGPFAPGPTDRGTGPEDGASAAQRPPTDDDGGDDEGAPEVDRDVQQGRPRERPAEPDR